MSIPPWCITAVYHFVTTSDTSNKRIENLDEMQTLLEKTAESIGLQGLLILGHEGINSTCAARTPEGLTAWKNFLIAQFGEGLQFKDSYSDTAPFRRFKVKQREEIVTAGTADLSVAAGKNRHLTPDEWNDVIKNDPDAVLIDTRNWYEYKIGSFKNAVNPDIEKFTEFPQWLESQGYQKDKKMLIFCTGGIRCEKGILELQRRGYDNVHQLQGGILQYLAEKPNEEFTGECFVFDNRVAVDQNLAASTRYKLCPHCGNPAEVKINCARCDTEMLICDECTDVPFKGETCSKNCAHWWEVHPGKKGARQMIEAAL